jgi:hypothetical protein
MMMNCLTYTGSPNFTTPYKKCIAGFKNVVGNLLTLFKNINTTCIKAVDIVLDTVSLGVLINVLLGLLI